MNNRLIRTIRFIGQWLTAGIVTNISSALLLVPGAIPAWLIYGYLAPRFGWPALSLLDVFALVYLVRLSQASASINVPGDSQPPDRGVKQ